METAVYKKVSLEDGEEEGDVEAPLRGGSTARSDEDDGRADSSPVKGAPAAAPGGALGEQELDEHHTTMEKLYYLLCMSLPISLGFFLNLGSAFINLAFAGGFSEGGDATIVFAGVSLSNMFFNIATLSLVVGLSTAVETLASYHNGAGNFRLVGITFWRSCLVLSGFALFLLPVLVQAKPIFVGLGIDPEVCEVVQRFLHVRMLTIPMDIVGESYQKATVAMGIISPTIIYSSCLNAGVLLLDLLFVNHLGYGYVSLAWSFVISTYVSGAVAMWYGQRFPEIRRVMILPTWEVAAEVAELGPCWEFFKLGFPGMLMLCSEWWAYEVLTVMAGVLGKEEVSAQAILMQILSLSFMIPLGMGIAACSIIGNAMGAGKKQLAVDIGQIALSTNVLIQCLVGFLIYQFGDIFVKNFTHDEKVLQLVRESLLFMAGFVLFDGTQAVGSSILRAVGKQNIGAGMNLVAFYIIGIPLSYYLSFVCGYGVEGLIRGLFFGCLFQCVFLLYLIIYREDDVYTIEFTTGGDADTAAVATGDAGGGTGGSEAGGDGRGDVEMGSRMDAKGGRGVARESGGRHRDGPDASCGLSSADAVTDPESDSTDPDSGDSDGVAV